MRPLTTTVNMNHAELKAWLANPRYMLASTATGHESLRRLAEGDHYRDPAFAQKADNFNTRHMLSGRLFGQEVGNSGYSKRHIALKNWGHDPGKSDSPLYDADQVWLSEHPGAEARRSARIKNPIVVTEVTGPLDARTGRVLADYFGTATGRAARIPNGMRYAPPDALYAPDEAYSTVPVGPYTFRLGLLEQPYAPNLSSAALRVGAEAHRRLNKDTMAGCACQLKPALEHGLASRYAGFDRAPNPPIGAWVLPIAQLIVSASGLYYSLTGLAGLVAASRSAAQSLAEGEILLRSNQPQ